MSATNFERRFVRYIFKNTGGFLPSWPLGKIVKLGDIIDLKRNRIEYLGNLGEDFIGIPIEAVKDPTPDDVKWQSKSNVSVSIKAKGELPAEGSKIPLDKAGITIEFTKQGGFLFQPKQLTYDRIKNLIAVRQEAMRKLAVELFGLRKIYYIKEVAHVKSYALTISQSSDSKYEVAAEGDIQLSTEHLASTEVRLVVKAEKSMDFCVTGKKGGAIFFKPERMRLKREKREEIVNNDPPKNALSDENLLAMISPSEINADSINNIMEFTPVTLEDIEELMGEEELVV